MFSSVCNDDDETLNICESSAKPCLVVNIQKLIILPSSGGGGLSLHDSNLLHECVNLMKFSPSDTGGDDIIHAIYGDIIHAELC